MFWKKWILKVSDDKKHVKCAAYKYLNLSQVSVLRFLGSQEQFCDIQTCETPCHHGNISVQKVQQIYNKYCLYYISWNTCNFIFHKESKLTVVNSIFGLFNL